MRTHDTRRRRIGSLTIGLLALLVLQAAPAADFNIAWHTLDGGGGFSAGGSFDLAGTIGQPDAVAGEMSGGSLTLEGGFWVALETPVPTCPGDADQDGDVDISDLGILLSQFGLTGPDLMGDVDADGDVDISDLGLLLANFGLNCG